MTKIKPGDCYCGRALHYKAQAERERVQQLVDILGEFIPVAFKSKKYSVQRHYIALHGLKGEDLAKLGFEEIK